MGVKFVDGYAERIAEASNSWAWIELEVHWMLWALMEVNPSVGACVTAQIFTFNAKLDALVALMRLREAPDALVRRVNAFGESSRSAQEARNRLAHDIWLTDNINPAVMGRARMIARRKLDFEVKSTPVDDLERDRALLEEAQKVISAIRHDVMDALPTLPKIPREAPHPLSGVR